MLDSLVVLAILLGILLYGLKCEFSSSKDSFSNSIPKETDSKKKTLKKIRNLMKVQNISVKWRKIYIATIVTIFFLKIQGKMEGRDVFIFLFTIFFSFYLVFSYFFNRDYLDILSYYDQLGKKLIDRSL